MAYLDTIRDVSFWLHSGNHGCGDDGQGHQDDRQRSVGKLRQNISREDGTKPSKKPNHLGWGGKTTKEEDKGRRSKRTNVRGELEEEEKDTFRFGK